MAKRNITEAEWPIMAVLWENGTATSAEIISTVMAERDVTKRTLKALINRLITKGAVTFTRDPQDQRVYHYRAAVLREDAVQSRTRSLLDTVYGNNPMKLLTHFVKNVSLSSEDMAELQRLLDEKKQDDKYK